METTKPKPLNSWNKKSLVKLVKEYETDIYNLKTELEDMELKNKDVEIVKEYIVMNGDDDKQVVYIKKRIKCVKDYYRNSLYVMELNRLTKQ